MDAPSALAVVFDCNPDGWRNSAALIRTVDQVLFFVNAFRILHVDNRLVVFGTHPTEVRPLWPSAAEELPAAPMMLPAASAPVSASDPAESCRESCCVFI